MARHPEGGAETGGVRAAETALRVLETVAWAGEPVGVTQIAAALGGTKSAIFRHLLTLTERGYLVQDRDTSRYRLGSRAFLIAHLAPPAWDLARVLEPPMREARDATGLAVVLSTPTPAGALVIATLHGTMPIEIGVRPGSELPCHASAQGKVFAAFDLAAPPPAKLPRFTAHTITRPAAVAQELARVRRDGWAVAPEEAVLGVNALAMPVRDHADAVVASVALVGSIQHIPATPDAALRATIRKLAAQSSRLLGNRRD
jgi:DNA-binding IclR family transcriptional regulator